MEENFYGERKRLRKEGKEKNRFKQQRRYKERIEGKIVRKDESKRKWKKK